MFIGGLIGGAIVWAVFRLFGKDLDRGVVGFVVGSIIAAGVFVILALVFGMFGGTVLGALTGAAGIQLAILALNVFTSPVELKR